MTTPDLTPTAQQGIGESVTAIAELKAMAERLGLTWQVRTATIDAIVNDNSVIATYDNDSNGVLMINMAGPLLAGDRVWVFVVPPQGNYVISRPASRYYVNATSLRAFPGTQTTTSAVYVTITGTSTTFTKLYDDTNLTLILSGVSTVTANPTGLLAALNIDNNDYDVASLLYNVNNSHLTWTGSRNTGVAPGAFAIPAGTYTVAARWRRFSGAGTLTISNDAQVSYTIIETL